MNKKIFANLKDNTQVIVFDEKSNDFNSIENIFSLDITSLKKIDFLKNLNSNIDLYDTIYYIKISTKDEENFFLNIKLNLDSIDNNDIKKEQYKDVNSIYLINSKTNEIYLKKVFPMQHISSKKILAFNDNPTYREESDKINLSHKVDVYYNISEKKLYFKNFNTLKLIFKDVVKYYREATHKEIKTFFIEDKFKFKDLLLNKLSNKFKKRLGCIIDSDFDVSDSELMKKYENYDKKYKDKLKKRDGKYVLETKAQLENFIELIEEKFYETPITREKREVNDFIKLNAGQD